MTRIVFASCMSVEGSTEQLVWKEVAAHNPEWLILCGDNIYMDYAPRGEQSKWWDPAKFATEMHKRYAQQFEVPAFRKLVELIPTNQVLGVWDDHDFAWDDCFGTDTGYDMPAKKKIATAMYHHYFAALNQRPLPATLPRLKIPDLANPPGWDRVVYGATTIGPLRVLLCDGRSYRQKITSRDKTESLLGEDQEKWLFGELARSSGPCMLVTGSTMTAGGNQSWDFYQTFFKDRFLPAVRGKTVIFMAGDVHKNRLPPRISDGWPVEAVSSAAVLTWHEPRYGVLEVSNVEVNLFLYKSGKVQYTGQLNLKTGDYKTSMEALLKAVPKPSVQQAQTQRRNALRRLHAIKMVGPGRKRR